MKYKPPFERRYGRLSVSASWRNLNLPRVFVYPDGNDQLIVGACYETPGVDPAVSVEVSLDGTRIARWVCSISWWLRKRRAKEAS
jgi:hypothetical protein